MLLDSECKIEEHWISVLGSTACISGYAWTPYSPAGGCVFTKRDLVTWGVVVCVHS